MNIHLIDSDQELSDRISPLENCKEISIDLEFDKNRYRYGFNLCLIQIGTREECLLVDPLSDRLTIKKLFPVLESDRVQKIVFAFGEDLRLLHSLGCYPKNIYDLSIATSLLNYPQKSLADYISDILNETTVNSSQQSDWYRRPLSDNQKLYAAQDVYYLKDMKKVLEQQAQSKNISDWIEEENSTYDELDYSGQTGNNYIKEKDKDDLTEHEWYIFRKLMEFREETARQFNKPSYQVLKKGLLVDIIRQKNLLRNWTKRRGIFRGIKNSSYQNQLQDILENSRMEAGKMGLSKTAPADKPLTREELAAERKERSKINQLKQNLFKPIKDRIAKDYGKETASYILSNRIMSNLITGDIDELENYKRSLIINYAKELGLDIDHLLEVVDH